jgi:hypothetical protein
VSTQQITLRTDSGLISETDALAERLGYSRNQYIELVLERSNAALAHWTGPGDAIAEAVLNDPALGGKLRSPTGLTDEVSIELRREDWHIVDIAAADLTVEEIAGQDQPVTEGLRGVRLTHVPTGLIVTSIHGSSQLENKAAAMTELRALVAAHPAGRPTSILDAPQPVAKRHFHRYREQISDTRYDKGVPMANHRCECGDVQYRKVEPK